MFLSVRFSMLYFIKLSKYTCFLKSSILIYKELGKNVLIYQNLLYIRNLKDENAGYYECFTEHGQSSVFHLSIIKTNEDENAPTTFGK